MTEHHATLTDAQAYALGKRVADLTDTRRTDGPGRVLDLILTELEQRHDYALLARVVDELDAADEAERAARAADEERREHARQDAATALTLDCPTCGQPAGQQCVRGQHGKQSPTPHPKRITASHEQHG